MRWPIETCCKDGKQLLGMGAYNGTELDRMASAYDVWHAGALLCGASAPTV